MMKIAYLDIRNALVPFSNPFWQRVIPDSLLKYILFSREPITLSHSVGGRYLLWQLLVKIGVENIDSLHMEKNEFGKLFFKHSPIHFNISHSGNLIICALSMDNAMGIDIEKILPVQFSDFKSCFNSEEWSIIIKDPYFFTFYKYWTQKEAILKAEGIGLIDDLSKLNPSDNRCYLPAFKSLWHLHELNISNEYCCYVASSKKNINLSVEKITPQI